MGIRQQVYDLSPAWLQSIFVSLTGYRLNRSRYGRIYRQYRSWLESFDREPLEKKLAYQDSLLIDFINHAQMNSPFYQILYEDLDLSHFSGTQDLAMLPLVDKDRLRAEIKNVYAKVEAKTVTSRTGGTTGKSLIVRLSYPDQNRRMALLDHFKSRVGFENRKMRRASFSGKTIIPPRYKGNKYWRYNHGSLQMLYSTFHMTEDNLALYIQSMNNFKPKALDGYFSSILTLANYINRKQIKLQFQPLAIFSTSETVTPAGRASIERAFGAKLYNQYAASEGAPLITECKEGILHVELSSGVFETIDDTSHEVAVTSFTTHATPLIRYRIGDSIRFAKQTTCACGIESLVATAIEGRSADFLLTTAGARIYSADVASFFRDVPNAIKQAQVIQEALGEVLIRLEIDDKHYRNEFDQIIQTEVTRQMGIDTSIKLSHVEHIEPAPSGKHALIINRLTLSEPGEDA